MKGSPDLNSKYKDLIKEIKALKASMQHQINCLRKDTINLQYQLKIAITSKSIFASHFIYYSQI